MQEILLTMEQLRTDPAAREYLRKVDLLENWKHQHSTVPQTDTLGSDTAEQVNPVS